MGRIQFSCCHSAGQQCWKYLRTILSHLNFAFLDFMLHFRAKYLYFLLLYNSFTAIVTDSTY